MTTKPFCPSCRPGKATVLAVPAIFAVLFLTGCSAVSVPPLEQREETIKRVARDGSVDYLHRWSGTAYDGVKEKPLSGPFSPDQTDVLTILGQPDYVRRPFVSQFGEIANEWIYLRQNKVFQFVEGKQVHMQPVTDIERTLIRFGYPTYSYDRLLENGHRRQTLVYRDWMGRKVELFSFVDGVLLVGAQ